MLLHRLRRRGTEVPKQGQSPNPILGRFGQTVEILRIKEGTVEKPHQAIHHIAGAMR
jgi:hypothetical protein